MERLLGRLKSGWRVAVTTVFVFLIFAVPGTKGILGKFITVDAKGGNNHGNNGHGNNGHHGNNGGHNGGGHNNGGHNGNGGGHHGNGGGHNGGGHHGGGNHSYSNHSSSASWTQTSSWGGPPHQNPPASPVHHGNSCSTGRRHSRSHHGHHRNRHPHYRPNGY